MKIRTTLVAIRFKEHFEIVLTVTFKYYNWFRGHNSESSRNDKRQSNFP